MALAVFDNLAETPDELAFRRGDTLTVLEQNTGGLEGWWLCSLRGRQVRQNRTEHRRTGGVVAVFTERTAGETEQNRTPAGWRAGGCVL